MRQKTGPDALEHSLWQIAEMAREGRKKNVQKEQVLHQLRAEIMLLRHKTRDLEYRQNILNSSLDMALDAQKRILAVNEALEVDLEKAHRRNAEMEVKQPTEQQFLDYQFVTEQQAQDLHLLQMENEGLREKLKAFKERGQNDLRLENELLMQKYKNVLRELAERFPGLQEDAGNFSSVLEENIGRVKRRKRN